MSRQPGAQLRIMKRQQQGRGSTGRKYKACPNCGEYYLRSMFIPDRNDHGKMKWIKVGLYCEGCGLSWTMRRKEVEESRGLEYDLDFS